MSLLPVGFGASGDDYEITDSLRFRSSASAFLSKTFASAGNQKTWTYSCWVKKANLGTYQGLLAVGTSDGNEDFFGFLSTDKLYFRYSSGSDFTSTQVFRDVSSWYHIVVVADTTQAQASSSASDSRLRYYVNGTQITAFDSGTMPSQNFDFRINSAAQHYIGEYPRINSHLDGYLTEVNFIDGQALTADDFGEYDANGTWKAKDYTGTYGTNGFYLPMKPTTQADGFNTVLYTGNDTTLSVNGVGFEPDFVWIKCRSHGGSASFEHILTDAVRGANKTLNSDNTNTEAANNATGYLSVFDSDGFTVTGGDATNGIGRTYAAWCWDAGSGSAASNTNGSITSTVKANDSYGFSIVSYTGNGTSGATIGHGLSSAPKMIIVKNRTTAGADWPVYHEDTGNTGATYLNTTAAFATDSTRWNNTSPTSTVFSVGNGQGVNHSSASLIAYCFSEVSGYSKIGSYTGTGTTTGNVTTTGFRPAFLMIKGTSLTSEWVILDNTRDPNPDPAKNVLHPNRTNADSTAAAGLYVKFTDTGFQPVGVGTDTNASGQTFIYMAFADTRDAKFNFDASGNKNNWLPNNINSNAESETTYDLMKDTPSLVDENAANFATLNPLNSGKYSVASTAEANLKWTDGSGGSWVNGTIAVSSGKWYWETSDFTGTGMFIGVADATKSITSYIAYYSGAPTSLYYLSTGQKTIAGSSSAFGAATTTSDLLGFALDADANTLAVYKNNVLLGTMTNLGYEKYSPIWSCAGPHNFVANFGQRPFKYTPPTGFLKLNTFNLPDSTIEKGDDYFNTVLWTGNTTTNGVQQAITGVGFQPDFVWAKSRNQAFSHYLYDSVRGVGSSGKLLQSNNTNAEATNVEMDSFDTDGFTVEYGSTQVLNWSSSNNVGWSWKANGSGVSNTDGDINSTVSANTTAGFSIATATTGSSYGSFPFTIGHGLGTAPAMVIFKSRSTAGQNWWVWHKDLPNAATGRGILLNSTGAEVNGGYFASNPATSTTMGINAAALINDNIVMYSFAEVPGYSAFGSYTGNGSSDGPFVYTGFRPAFVIIKETTSTGSWVMLDTTRSTYNVINNDSLWANLSSAEGGSASYFDMLSNGFKIKDTDSDKNSSGQTYIYMAFAENPFKNALAR